MSTSETLMDALRKIDSQVPDKWIEAAGDKGEVRDIRLSVAEVRAIKAHIKSVTPVASPYDYSIVF